MGLWLQNCFFQDCLTTLAAETERLESNLFVPRAREVMTDLLVLKFERLGGRTSLMSKEALRFGRGPRKSIDNNDVQVRQCSSREDSYG